MANLSRLYRGSLVGVDVVLELEGVDEVWMLLERVDFGLGSSSDPFGDGWHLQIGSTVSVPNEPGVAYYPAGDPVLWYFCSGRPYTCRWVHEGK